MASAKSIIELVVPQYLMITILSPLAAWLLIIGLEINAAFFLAVISLSFAMLGFNTLNMIFDRSLDAINKPQRPIPSGKISVKEALVLLALFYAISLTTAMFSGIRLLIIILAFITISFLYTNPVTYLRRYFWSTSVIGGVIYGAIPFLSAWAASGVNLPFVFLLFFSFLIFFIAPSKDMEDVKGERMYRINSIPILIGRQKTMLFVTSGTISLISIMAILSLLDLISRKFVYASILSITIFLLLNKDSIRHKKYSYKNITTQSHYVSVNMIAAVTIELIFALSSIL